MYGGVCERGGMCVCACICVCHFDSISDLNKTLPNFRLQDIFAGGNFHLFQIKVASLNW